ncbi:MAG: two-component regulator propeller domain-containing protein, partial [Vicinamibacteria bacterium]
MPLRVRRVRARSWTALPIFVALSLPVWAPGAESLDHVGREQGLTTDNVTALYQDHAGLVWIGSRDGLRSYDGYSFRLFDHDTSDPRSLSDNAIRAIFEDSRGRFWVGTNAGGLELMDRGSGTFRHFRHDSADPRSISHDSVYAIVEDPHGALWVGTQRGLNRLDPEGSAFERAMADANDPAALSNDYVSALLVDGQGALWVATVGGGLLRRDPETGRFRAFRFKADDRSSIGSDRVFAIAEDPSRRIWVGTDKGVAEVDPDRGVLRRFEEKEDGSGLSRNTVTSLWWSPDQTLWVGTLDGLDEITSSGRVTRHRYPEKAAPSRSFLVTSVMLDREGRVWAGTWGAGLVRLKTGTPPFDVALAASDVTAVVPDRSRGLWVATLGGELSHRDSGAAGFHPIAPKRFGAAILSVLEARDDALWVGTYKGLQRIARGPDQVTTFAHDPSNPESLGPGYVTAVLEDSAGRVWVATGGGGLQRLKKDGRGFDHFVNSPRDPSSLSDDYVTVLHESRNGTLWVGTRSGGLNECDLKEVHCRRHLPGGESSVSHHYVTSIHEDAQGALWIGTAGGGLNLLPSTAGPDRRFTHYTVREGLPDNNVMSIVEDGGLLWLGTKHGLARFDPSSREVIQYGADDGLPSDEFDGSAAARDDGHLYFGTAGGLLSIPRGQKLEPARASPVAFTAIRTLRGATQSDMPLPRAAVMEIPYGTVVSFEAAVLDFGDPSRHHYEYQLQGLSPQWVDLG